MLFYSTNTLQKIYEIAKKYNLLLIIDECATGFFRTGKTFAFNHANIKADIIVLGKALTGGMITLAATVTTEEIYNKFLSNDLDNALMHGPSFMGNPLAANVANASLDLFNIDNLNPNLNSPYINKVSNISKIMTEIFSILNYNDNVKEVRILGAIAAIEIPKLNWDIITKIRENILDYKIWIRPFGNVIYIMPPLTISDKDLKFLSLSIIKIIKDFF